MVLIFISPLIVLSILSFHVQPGIAIAFFVGNLLGIFRLKAFFGYITCVINREKFIKDTISLIKYVAILLFSLGAIGFILFKSIIIGLAILLGLITVPIIVMIYTMLKGISLYRQK
jgi:hypothetical protein